MNDRFTTIAGWVLGCGIVLLGAILITGEFFKSERPEKMGYAIPGVQAEGEGAAPADHPIAFYLQTANPTHGAEIFQRCQTCHNADQGGPNAVGPNLWGAVGSPIAHRSDYSYSDALHGHGGTWTWDNLNAWLTSPSSFASGTKMTFAGLSSGQDRADVLAFLNQHGGSLQIPPPPAEATANRGGGNTQAQNAAETAGQGAGGRAPQQPVLSSNQVAPNPNSSSIGGPGVPQVTGTASQRH